MVKNNFLISDPSEGQKLLDADQIIKAANGNIEIIAVERVRQSPKARFGLKWFVPSIKKHKFALQQVVIASFCSITGF